MIRRFFLLSLLLYSASCQQNTQTGQEDDQHPNIIYILADDLGIGDLSSYNRESKIPTPNLDRFASEGIRFTDAHSNSAVCTPTRYGTLTGRYAFRTRLKSGVLWGYSAPLIDKGTVTVASFLKQQGYQTACIGKWHLGLEWPKLNPDKEIPDIQWNDEVTREFEDNVDYAKEVQGGPSDHGFDHSFIIPASLDMSPYCYIRNGKVVEAPTDFTEGRTEANDGRGVIWRPGKVSPGFDFDQVFPTVVDSACQYINRKAGNEQPFFLYLPLPAPHTPWLPLDEYQGKSGAGTYGDFVAMVDDMIGKVLQTLDDNELRENTLVIITSDNGADWRPEDIEAHQHRANYFYKGRKADIYEAGHRVPYLARWPQAITAGTTSAEVLCATDLLATVAGLLEQQVPTGAGEDSYNLWPAFIGKGYNSPIRNETIHHSLDGYFAIRQGKWKYTPQLGSGGFSKPQTIAPGPEEAPGTLYDLENDPSETNNLYDQHPEKVQQLHELLNTVRIE
ncbi:MAG: sulfatase-like hydrolase/transferase [Cyclobacteriaceae bacterium]|nr:sulfatase-like hydrolase/transferase [Cyclobacteriaceae bacterium]